MLADDRRAMRKKIRKLCFQVFQRYGVNYFVRASSGKEVVEFLAGIDAAEMLRDLLKRLACIEEPPSTSEYVVDLIALAMRNALHSRSHNVLRMLLELQKDEEVFPDGVRFPDPFAMLVMLVREKQQLLDGMLMDDMLEDELLEYGWLGDVMINESGWNVLRVILSDPHGNTLLARQKVMFEFSLGIFLPDFLDDFCSSDDSLGLVHHRTFKDDRWKKNPSGLVELMKDKRFVLGDENLCDIFNIAAEMNFDLVLNEVLKATERLGVNNPDYSPFSCRSKEFLPIACRHGNATALDLLLNWPNLKSWDTILQKSALECEDSLVSKLLHHPRFAMKDRPDLASNLAISAFYAGKFKVFQVLQELHGPHLFCPKADGSCAIHSKAECDVRPTSSQGPGLRRRRLPFPTIWEAAFDNPNVLGVKLMLPFQKGFEEISRQINMKIEGAEFLIRLHTIADWGGRIRRKSLLLAVNQGWTKLVQALIPVVDLPKSDLKEIFSELDSSQPPIIESFLSSIPATVLDEVVDFPYILANFSPFLRFDQDPPSKRLRCYELSFQLLLNNPHTRRLLNFPDGLVNIPHPIALKLLLAFSTVHPTEFPFDGNSLLRRLWFNDSYNGDMYDFPARAAAIEVILRDGRADPLADDLAFIAQAAERKWLRVVKVFLDDPRVKKHYGVA
ncbi:hypothetical protein HDU96_007173 [Phlyctochytrium bullatum]|nr:hypothetical protein HDU96_007173 [Phlyctochytrium bullatum]